MIAQGCANIGFLLRHQPTDASPLQAALEPIFAVTITPVTDEPVRTRD
jgi:hypothetical protein